MKTFLLGFVFLMVMSFENHPKTVPTDVYYQVDYISTTQVGSKYEWVWKVTNPFPGNGKNGTTLQDLSHWDLVLGSCITQADLVSAAYSNDGINWHTLPATIHVDPSQSCYTQPVMKFDIGLNDDEPTYYKLVVNRPLTQGYMPAVFKSGRNTGCYVGTILGMTCDVEPPRE